ncbi:MAG: hypothetical protein AAGF97_03910 [Planctomycetota bacterium]
MRAWLGASLGVLLLAGCAQDGSGLVRVRGTLKYEDGTPVTGELATIVFQPDTNKRPVPPKSASGTIGPDGSFELMTQEPGDGAHPGTYKVVLKVWENYREQEPGVDQQYADARTTPLDATVSPDSKQFDFVIQR